MVLIKEQNKAKMDVMWKKFNGIGLEHLFLLKDDESIKVNSVILTMKEDMPVRILYNIYCNLDWKVKNLIYRYFMINIKILYYNQMAMEFGQLILMN
ncbi:putative glycolipid-binding domain-containing protein [Clostridium botulinum]|nr:putative glycolipid-binding domain-containing protein [Clostridium botulinum]MCS4475617.1 putative glycolipid-binding domain-containing protein [Clostridium botulinum]